MNADDCLEAIAAIIRDKCEECKSVDGVVIGYICVLQPQDVIEIMDLCEK